MNPVRVVLLAAVAVALVSTGWALLASPPTTPVPRLQIEVLNGCGEAGLAQRAAQRLQLLGQEIEGVADAEHHEFARTILIDRRGKSTLTRRLAQSIGPCQVVLERTDDAEVDVTLVLGRDWATLGLFSTSSPASLGR